MNFKEHGEISSILIVDDHPLYCDALAASLRSIYAPDRIDTATNLEEALQYSETPDLVILDLKLPDVTGLDGFTAMRERMPDVPIVVISAIVNDYVIRQIKDMGGAGYISKSASQATFQDAFSLIRQGKRYFKTDLPFVAGEDNCADGSVLEQASQSHFDLTPQQGRILRLICAGKPNKLIAFELNLAEATVKAHVTALFRRLGVHNRTQAAILVQNEVFGESDKIASSQ